MSVSEQYQNQRALARMNRSRHGADTSLDDAEVRYDAMADWLYAGRYWLPIMATAAIGWMGVFPSSSWPAGLWIVVTTIVGGMMIGTTLDAILGAFHAHIKIKTENVCFKIGGVVLCATGVVLLSPGLIVSGVGLFIFPARWKRIGCNILANSDYERLTQEAAAANETLRIIE